MKRYVDTSVLVGFVVNEVHTTQIRHRMQDTRWLNVISDWTVTEFYAALAFKLRTKQITSEVKREAEAFFEHAKAAMFEIIAVQRSDFRLATALGSRPELGLRAGDALHMALAQRVGGTLWTVDYRFRDAAEKVGIVVEPG